MEKKKILRISSNIHPLHRVQFMFHCSYIKYIALIRMSITLLISISIETTSANVHQDSPNNLNQSELV